MVDGRAGPEILSGHSRCSTAARLKCMWIDLKRGKGMKEDDLEGVTEQRARKMSWPSTTKRVISGREV